VPVGWQAVFRARDIEGPYEARTVMEQGDTLINGPHQGAWVATSAGEDWFFHFQSRLPYGRVVHLQPMHWRDDWPVIGLDPDGDGIGNPVASYRKPRVAVESPIKTLPFADDFSSSELALQWQWNANQQPGWYSLSARPGYLRLFAQPQPPAGAGSNLWHTPSLLLQKLPAPEFILETTLELPPEASAMTAGLLMYGEDYAWIGVRQAADGTLELGTAGCRDARQGCVEEFHPEVTLSERRVSLRMTVAAGGGTAFSYRTRDGRFRAIGELFQARPGRWVGAKVGLFARGESAAAAAGHIDVDGFRFSSPARLTGRSH
jgi:beta-xylosidase